MASMYLLNLDAWHLAWFPVDDKPFKQGFDGNDDLRQQYYDLGWKQTFKDGEERWNGKMNLICESPRQNGCIMNIK